MVFPPRIENSLEQALTNLWKSLQRAGGYWKDNAILEDTVDSTKVVLAVTIPIPEQSKKDVAGYIKGYLLQSGWKVSRVKIRKHYVELLVSNA